MDIVTNVLQFLGGTFLVGGVVSWWTPVLLGNLGDIFHRRANLLVFLRAAREDFNLRTAPPSAAGLREEV